MVHPSNKHLGGSSSTRSFATWISRHRREALSATTIIVVALMVMSYRLSVPSIWIDEASSWNNVRGGWWRLLEFCVGGDDSSGLLYAHILKLWTGASGAFPEARMRFLSILFTLVFIGLMYLAAWFAWGSRAATFVEILAAAHPLVIFWSRQARAYSLLLACASLCILGLVLRLTGRAPRLSLFMIGCGSAMLVLTHLFAAFFVMGLALVLAYQPCEELKPGSGGTLRRMAGRVAPLRWAALLLLLWVFVTRARIHNSLAQFWTSGSMLEAVQQSAAALLPPIWLYGTAAVAGLIVLGRQSGNANPLRSTTILVLLGVIALGPILTSLLARGGHHFVHPRYMISAVPLLVLPVGYLFSRAPIWLGAPGCGVLACTAAYFGGTLELYKPTAPWGDDIRSAAAIIRSSSEPNDALLVLPWCERISLEYYGVGLPVAYTPDDNVARIKAEWPDLWGTKVSRIWIVLVRGEPGREYEAMDYSGHSAWKLGTVRLIRIDDPAASRL